MHRMKRFLTTLLLAACMLSSLTGCGSKANEREGNGTLPIADNSVDFAYSLKLGWNLGNTLESTGTRLLNAETAWGQPKTTKEMIDYVKEAGFTGIRIPVTWSSHMNDDYTIDEMWMDRVQEVVDYGLDAGLYVILNSHHDCEKYFPSEENLENGKAYLAAVWTQISERFKDYDERLIFESMNEPRLINTAKEWWFTENDPDGLESIRCIVEMNQTFVDTVRSGEHYNKTRYLMVPSNAASAQNALSDAFSMPEDEADRVILSVHAYSPYDFAMNANGYTEWTEERTPELSFLDDLYEKFVKNGYGVVIGEMGAINKDNYEDRVAWAKDYTKKASANKMSCFLWDNNGTKIGSENFAMIDRRNRKIYYPEMLNAMLANYQ